MLRDRATRDIVIACASLGETIPPGAMQGTCALCPQKIIFDPIGIEKVKQVEGQMPRLVCWECLYILQVEDGPAIFKGWARDAT